MQLDQSSEDRPHIKQVLVGGPLLGSRQRNIPSDFAAWDQFEPIITPEIQLDQKGKHVQRFVLLPHSQHITVLAYQTGSRIASLVPFMGDDESKDFALEGNVEHGSVDSLVAKLARMRDLDSDKARAHFTVIKELLEHHIDEEHTEMFKQLDELFSSEELAAMGERFEADKAAPPRRRPARSRATAAA